MSALRVLPAADRTPTPWKNGGGVTREIAMLPAADGDGFEWRISMAEVASAGPFSRFDGIDRTLVVLSGVLELDLPDGSRRLGAGDVIAFAGEAPVVGAPIDGVATDLNVMVRRDRWQVAVERRMPPFGAVLPRGDGTIVLFSGQAMARCGDQSFDLSPSDAIHLDAQDEPVFIASAYGIHVVQLDRARRHARDHFRGLLQGDLLHRFRRRTGNAAQSPLPCCRPASSGTCRGSPANVVRSRHHQRLVPAARRMDLALSKLFHQPARSACAR